MLPPLLWLRFSLAVGVPKPFLAVTYAPRLLRGMVWRQRIRIARTCRAEPDVAALRVARQIPSSHAFKPLPMPRNVSTFCLLLLMPVHKLQSPPAMASTCLGSHMSNLRRVATNNRHDRPPGFNLQVLPAEHPASWKCVHGPTSVQPASFADRLSCTLMQIIVVNLYRRCDHQGEVTRLTNSHLRGGLQNNIRVSLGRTTGATTVHGFSRFFKCRWPRDWAFRHDNNTNTA